MSPPPSGAAATPALHQPALYSAEERAALLRLAHQAIEARLAGIELNLVASSAHLEERRGAFTTLRLDGELRGCVGYVLPLYSLYRTVAETAVGAAFHDVRFPPLRAEEAPRLKIDISVLSAIEPILPDHIEVGLHGLVITYSGRRGLLLPQVAVERGWDRRTFLEQTCLKSGCPPDAWQRGAIIEAFTAEIFGEE
jgi:AmmeMemoRadiSam system protein A